MPASPALGVSSMLRHSDYWFRDGTVLFMVQNTEFRLHRYLFERDSNRLRSQLTPLGKGEDDLSGGPCKVKIEIEGVTSGDFADLLWVFYNAQYTFDGQTKEKWLTILRLATLWEFNEIKKLAVRHLEKIKLEPIEKITTYKLYSVDGKLLLPSYAMLCRSPTLPSPEEGKLLTLETVLNIAGAREKILLRSSEVGCKTPTIASAPEDIVTKVVDEIFGLTLRSDDPTVQTEGQTGSASGDGSADKDTISVKQPKPKVNGREATPQPQENVDAATSAQGNRQNGVNAGGNAGSRGRNRQNPNGA